MEVLHSCHSHYIVFIVEWKQNYGSDLWLTKILAAFLRPALNLKKGQPRGIVDHIIAIPESPQLEASYSISTLEHYR